jgi:hypothetical protein
MTDIARNEATATPAPAETPAPGPVIVPVQTVEVSGAVAEVPPPQPAATVQVAPATAPANEQPATTSVEVIPQSRNGESVKADATVTEQEEAPKAPKSILAIDIGGTKVKLLATGHTEPRKAPTGKEFTPAQLVEVVREQARDWEYEAISIGYPGLVGPHGPRSEPGNLGPGWVGFDFAAAFEKPVKMINDAAMQALGSYEGGRMLFLGLGTGLGSALITGHVIIPLELGKLPFDDKRTLGQVLGRDGLEKLGKNDWRDAVNRTVTALMGAFVADYVVIGGGNAKNVKGLPPGARMGHNQTAFRGGFRIWSVEDVWELAMSGAESQSSGVEENVRVL